MFNYVEQAHVTASGSFHGHMIHRGDLKDAMREFIEAGERLDAIKKALFYGRKTELFVKPTDGVNSINSLPLNMLAGNPDEAINLFHGIIGKATETAELIEALEIALFNDKPLDHTNVGEEVGDGMWYDALISRAIGQSLEEIQTRNIAKLKHRFPEKFDEFFANNRDLYGERTILEGAIAPISDSIHAAMIGTEVPNSKREMWSCKIGNLAGVEIPDGGDWPMREAVRKAFIEVTGEEPEAIFSGWGDKFTDIERSIMQPLESIDAVNIGDLPKAY